jgi:serine phosphatase RsbU (regulator of sigma subunit)
MAVAPSRLLLNLTAVTFSGRQWRTRLDRIDKVVRDRGNRLDVPDLLLGLDADTARQDHTADLPAGTGVLFYTDGLVERRDASIDDGLAWLVDAAAERSGRSPDELCDYLVDRTAEHASDDIAPLAVRLR